MDLERELSTLELDWPRTPELRLELGARRRRRLRRPYLIAVALLLVALAAAFAVPKSRGAILRFLHLGGVTIELVDRLPAAQERPLGGYLGELVTQAQAEQALRHPLRVPPVEPLPPLHLEQGAVSCVFLDRGRPVLLSEIGFSDPGILKKVIGGSTSVAGLTVEGGPGFFLSGSEHVLMFPGAPPRVAGNVLIWQAHGLTLRLEGQGLTKARAVELAGLLRNK
jgi:hypothetical protein